MYVMGQRQVRKRQPSWLKRILIVLAALVVLAAAGGLWVRSAYLNGLKPVDSSSQEVRTITIESGATPAEIAEQLKNAGLIRSTWVFRWFVNRSGVQGSLQAGTYELSPSQSLEQIVAILSHGKVTTNPIAILPGQRLSSIREMLITEGFSERDVDAALNPANYADHPALTDKPLGASLEGYLYPESFHKTSATTPQEIVKQALDEMAKALTPDIREGIKAQGLTVHEGIILASVVGKEVSDNNPDDRPKVAQVFLKRLKIGMKLQSDATNNYPPSFDTYSIAGLPPEPLSNVTQSMLAAVASPASTDYLYFVTGRDCVTRFSATLAEHEAFIQQHGVARPEDNCT
jgi:conserved hypothetical protein TIGR00247